jgi:hypothetical protein
MHANRTKAFLSRVGWSLIVGAAVFVAALQPSSLAQRAGPAARQVRMRTIHLAVPVGIMGPDFWVYGDGRLLGSDQTVRLIQPATSGKITYVETPAGHEVFNSDGTEDAVVNSGNFMHIYQFPAQFHELVEIDIPSATQKLTIVYRNNDQDEDAFPLLASIAVDLNSHEGEVEVDGTEYIPGWLPIGWEPEGSAIARAATAAPGPDYDYSKCFLTRDTQTDVDPTVSGTISYDTGEVSYALKTYQENVLVQALRAAGPHPEIIHTSSGESVVWLNIPAPAKDFVAEPFAGLHEYDAREMALITQSVANAAGYFQQMPGRLQECAQKFPQFPQFYAALQALAARVSAEVDRFRAMAPVDGQP